MQSTTASDRHNDLQSVIKSLIENADGIVHPIEGLPDLTVVIADVDNRSDDSSIATRTESSADIISGQRANCIGALCSVDEVESWTN